MSNITLVIKVLIKKKTELKPGMLYDIASLTKVVGTTTRILQLIDEHKIHLTDKIGMYISDFRHPEITIYQLLTHTSGLPADFDNVHSLTKEQLITKIINVDFFARQRQCILGF
ncbi:serine hydrolase [Amylolactobacillus amylophilus]|uniref:serine hydrolase n=1 Tax=Amylolactobacillus amylophilus TaxID=1603 RepID=UPI000A79E7D4|nr:serine hydrolase [Amylolactobacillus amylophilus]